MSKIKGIKKSGAGTIEIDFVDGRVVGELIGDEFRLDGFKVFERGKGLGRENYLLLENELKKLGVKHIYLQTMVHAKGFWEKMGFRQKSVIEDGAKYAMQKSLGTQL